jgi:hypothetical protein
LRSRASNRWCSTSEEEPRAICKNLTNSPSDRRPQPSAILAPIETAARRSWLVNPYISSRGKDLEASYTASDKSYALRQTLSSLKSFNSRSDYGAYSRALQFLAKASDHTPLALLHASSQKLAARSFLHNSSPPSASPCRSSPVQRAR